VSHRKLFKITNIFFCDFLFFLFSKKETKNLRCAKIPKNTNKKAKTFKLLLLALILCLQANCYNPDNIPVPQA